MKGINDALLRIDFRRILKYGVYMFLVLTAQNMIFTQIRPLGVCPMVLPAAAVAVGMFEGVAFGTAFSVIMGIFADMAYVENTVAFTLVFPILAFASGFVTHFFINRKFFAFMGAAFAGILITALLQMLKTFAMDGWAGSMLLVVVLQTLWSMPPAALTYFFPAKWSGERL